MTHKIDFDRNKVDKMNSGLMVAVKLRDYGYASVSIAGLDRIVDFMCDFECIGKDLDALRGRKVTAYHQRARLLGISRPE